MSTAAPVGAFELAEEPAFATPWMTVRRGWWRRPDRTDVWYYQDHPGCALVLPLTVTGELLLTRIWRPAIQQWCVEAPAGRIDAGEAAVDGALRELAEEVGGVCSDVHELGRFFTSTGSSNEVVHLFLATGVTRGEARPDPGEVIEPWEILVRQALQDVVDGRIADGPTALAITLAHHRGLLGCEPETSHS